MKNLGNMMKQAQQMQERMQQMQEGLASAEVTGQAGAGMVTVTMNGKGDVASVKIDKNLVDPDDVEVLEDLVAAAVNDGRAKVEAMVQEKTQEMMGGLSLPPGMKLPF
ncbi:MAG: YbaB/EbfC family nucleoid-associated protein [Pseudomonadota bacterium]